jgi:hypothetical protein
VLSHRVWSLFILCSDLCLYGSCESMSNQPALNTRYNYTFDPTHPPGGGGLPGRYQWGKEDVINGTLSRTRSVANKINYSQLVLSSRHASKCPPYLLLSGIKPRFPCSPTQRKFPMHIAVCKTSLLHVANQSIAWRPLERIAILIPVECTGRAVNSCYTSIPPPSPSFLFPKFWSSVPLQ